MDGEISVFVGPHRRCRPAGATRHAAKRLDRILVAILRVNRLARAEIEASQLASIDYLELVDAETLQPVTQLNKPAVLATAVFYGDVRLIDHVQVGKNS